jgi:para-nitrobenzyl esterase
VCIQGSHVDAGEDCLFLNVYTPARNTIASEQDGSGRSDRALPVMLWIHGGSYVSGASNQYPGEALVAASNGTVVVITINYRLNVFGFLGSKELKTRSPDGTTGNYGIEDQRLAMSWARQHIAAFGGDPEQITIFGESAGGNSVINHLAQSASFPLYQRAIVESGAYE